MLGAGSDFDRQDRRAHRRIDRRLHNSNRYPQHAAGGAGFGIYGLHVSGRTDRLRSDQYNVHEPAGSTHAGLHHWALRVIQMTDITTTRVDHTAKAFDTDLQEITRKVAEMGGLVERQIADSVRALVHRDVDLGERVVALDEDFYPQKLIRGVEHMSALVLAQVKQVLDAYASRDLQSALAVWNGDEQVDSMCVSLFRELLTYMMEDPRNITFCMHLMFCAKDIERMGDHATNIAETVYYMVEGRPITDQRPKGDTTSFPAGILQK